MDNTLLKQGRRKNVSILVNSLVSIAIIVIFSAVQPPEPITKLGMQVTGILLGVIYAWCTIDIIWPSIIGLIVMGFTSFTSTEGAFISAAAAPTPLFILALFFFVGIMAKTGLARTIAIKIISAKITHNRPWVLTFMILLAAFIPGLIVGGLPAALLCWDICYGIFELTGYSKGEKWPTLVLFGVAAVANMAMSVLPFQMGVAAMTGVMRLFDPSFSINAIHYILFELIFCALNIGLIMLLMRFVLKPDMSKLANYTPSTEKERFTKDQRTAFVLLVLLIALFVFAEIPGAVGSTIKSLGNIGITSIVVAAALIIRRKDGSPYLKFKEISKDISWELLFMVATVMFIAGSMTDERIGVVAFLSKVLVPIFEGKSLFTFSAVILLIAVIGTNFVDNSVIGFVITPLAFTLSVGMGYAPAIVFVPLVQAACYGLLLPASSPTGAILHSNIDWLYKKDIFKLAGLFVLIFIIVTIITIPLSATIFG